MDHMQGTCIVCAEGLRKGGPHVQPDSLIQIFSFADVVQERVCQEVIDLITSGLTISRHVVLSWTL